MLEMVFFIPHWFCFIRLYISFSNFTCCYRIRRRIVGFVWPVCWNATTQRLIFQTRPPKNVLVNFVVSVDAEGGSAYGGAIALYIVGFSSVFSSSGDAVAAVGDTVVRNVSVALITAMFQSCSVMRNGFDVFGASAYGESFSFYVGAYTWSRSVFGSSSSSCGSTNISGVEVRVQNASFFDSRSSITGSSIIALCRPQWSFGSLC
jgi:hypothetical protein